MAKKELQKKDEQEKELIPFELDAGSGFEDADVDAYALPFLTILQSMSPQVDEDDSSYIKGAKPGMIFNTVTEELFSEVKVVPVKYQRQFIEWVPRTSGGGFVANHGSSPAILEHCKKDGITENGNEIKDHRNHYIVLFTDKGPQEAIISMTSSQIKKSRKWMSQMQGLKIKGITPAMFASIFILGTVKEENDKGKWYGWTIEREGWANKEQYQVAKNFKNAIDRGIAKADFSKAEEKTEF